MEILYRLSFSIFILLLCLSSNSQNLKTFDKSYVTQHGDTGHAKYTYRINGIEEQIKEGDFIYTKSTKTDSLSVSIVLSEKWEGKYKNNKKHGIWHFEESIHKIDFKGVAKGKVDYGIASNVKIITGNYKKGIPNGEWIFEQKRNINDIENPPLKNLKFNFENGKIQGTVSGFAYKEGLKNSFSGLVEKGLMVGSWKFVFGNSLEIRDYENGILLRQIKISNSKDTVSNIEFPISPTIQKGLETGKNSSLLNKPVLIQFNDGYPRSSIYIKTQSPGNNLLDELLEFVLKHESGKGRNEVLIGTNRGVYPLTDEEKISLNKWYALDKEYHNLIREMHIEEIVDLHNSENDTLKMIANWVDIQEQKMGEVEDWIDHWVSHKLERTYRNGLLTDTAKLIFSKDEIKYGGKTYTVLYENVKEENLINYLAINFEYRVAKANLFLKIYRKKVKSYKLTNKTLILQNGILDMKNDLDSSLKANLRDPSLNRLVYKVHDLYLDNIVEGDYHAFLEAEADKEKQAILGDSIVRELKSIEEIYRLCQKIADRRRKIDTIYTELIFDPFTFTDNVPIRVKSRLYTVVAVQMFNQMVDRAILSPTPYQCQEELKKLYSLQGRLIFLKDSNTKALEKKLRKEKLLDERLKLIEEYVGR